MAGEGRRVTDRLDLTAPQRAFLDQVAASVTAAVAEAIVQHEDSAHVEVVLPEGVTVQDLIDNRVDRETVHEVVKLTLAAGDFMLPNGVDPEVILEKHKVYDERFLHLEEGQTSLENRHDQLDRNVDRILDVVVGPVKEDFLGEPHADGERDESLGLMAQTATALSAAKKLDKHLSNGGVPVKLPTNVKAAIWGAAGTVIAASITTLGVVAAAVLM